jgi:uroporphyrinogen decarboxylase
MTRRELVFNTLSCSGPGEVPREMWTLPWAKLEFGDDFEQLVNRFPNDIVHAPEVLSEPLFGKGDPYRIGTYIDPWGAEFVQLQDGIIGEIKNPLVATMDWSDADKVHFPRERLTFNRELVNQFCRESDRFVLSPLLARPFERMQFLRGTEQLYMDLGYGNEEMLAFFKKIHRFNLELIEAWVDTEIDGIFFMDDWGSQSSLLVNPAMWREIFKPFYADYINLAHSKGKKTFMHSDGFILDILPDLIELGLDAINSQIFCMGLDKLSSFAGKITFWGEIDRQHLLSMASFEEVQTAVQNVFSSLWNNGGCIAQCEFGPGGRIENVRTVFEEWERISKTI